MSRPVLRTLLVLVVLAILAACTAGPGPELGDSSADSSADATTADDGPIPTAVVPEAADDVDTLVVGVILDGSNLLRPIDRQPGVAFAGAIDGLNEAGGVLGMPVELVVTDAESRLSAVDAGARRAIDAGAVMLVVTCELDFAGPAVTRADEVGIVVMSPCAGEDAWGNGEVSDLAFSMVAPAAVYGADMAELVWSEGDREAAILYDDSAPETRGECAGFEERWAQLGGRTTIVTAINPSSGAIAENPALLAELDTDIVIVCAFDFAGTRALQQIRSSEVVTPILAGLSLDSAEFRPRDIDGLGDFRLLSFASPDGDDPEPEVADAIERFRLVDGIPPASGRFVLGADLALAWAAAVEAAGTTDGAAVAAALEGFATIDAASGPVGFGGGHAVTDRVLRVRRHVDGTLVFERTWPG